jgi:hypothetical protein
VDTNQDVDDAVLRQIKTDMAGPGDKLQHQPMANMPPPITPVTTSTHDLRRVGGSHPSPVGNDRPSASPKVPPTPRRSARNEGTSRPPVPSQEGQSQGEKQTTTRAGRTIRETPKAKQSREYQEQQFGQLADMVGLNFIAMTATAMTAHIDIDDRVPRTYQEAINAVNAPLWIPPIDHEIEVHTLNGTWELIPISELPAWAKIVGTRWVFAIKQNEQAEVVKRKARIVAQGFSQRPGFDYNETYSPVVRYDSLRLIIMIATLMGWFLHQVDFDAAYLNGLLKHIIYARCPPGLPNSAGKCLKLLKTLYGLKQSGREWYQVLSDFLLSIGFVQAQFDPCVYIQPGQLILGVYVDDVLLAGTMNAIKSFLQLTGACFKFKDLGRCQIITVYFGDGS